MSIPIAAPSDLATYLGLDLVTLDLARAELAIRLAQDKCEAIVTPLTSAALGVVLDVAARMFTNPRNVTAETTGPFNVALPPVAGGSWLTRANIADLRRLSGRSGAFSIETMPATAGQGLPWWDTGVVVATDSFDVIP